MRKSTSGIVIMNAGATILWSSRRQDTIADSTAKAEIIAANAAAKDVWTSRLLSKFMESTNIPVVYIDNVAALCLAANPLFHQHTKHIERKHFFIRELIENDKLRVEKVSTNDQIADIFTKPLVCSHFRLLRSKLGLV